MKLREFKLERYFAEYEFSTPFMLSGSDSETHTIQDILALEEGAEKAFMQLPLGYTESQGHPSLRHEISKLYKNISKDEIIVFSGAEEGIFTCINGLFSQGDHIIVQFPGYQSLYEVAIGNQVDVSRWIMNEENNWELETDE
ncbi:MAG: aminotransferase class I/II-fold pyridoxal phosphate-dependent enzyme, partial [Candidatus Kariarchaeaceae archaeon]